MAVYTFLYGCPPHYQKKFSKALKTLSERVDCNIIVSPLSLYKPIIMKHIRLITKSLLYMLPSQPPYAPFYIQVVKQNTMKRFLIVFAFILSFSGYAQGEQIVIGQQFSIKSTILNEERKIAVYKPKNYDVSTEKYQVLYLLDSKWNFPFVSSLVDKLTASGDVPPMLVIGVVNNNRNKDLTPPGINDNKNRYGGGDLFLEFLTKELQPWVDEKFRTHPYKVLAGHSFGGLFTIYSMMQHPGAFQSYIALSPSLGRNSYQQVKIAGTFFKSENTFPKSLFITIGNEGGYTYNGSKKLADVLDTYAKDKFRFKFEELKEESHTSITTQGFIEGLQFVYANINPERMPGLDEIFLVEEHFKTLSKRFGYEVKVPEEYYKKFVKEQLAERELDYALFILEKYQNNYSKSPYLLRYYADVYLLKGEFDNAKKYYLKLKERGIENEYVDTILNQIKN